MLCICFVWAAPCRAEVTYPIIASEQEAKTVVRRLNAQNIKVAKYALEESRFEDVKFEPGSFSFTIEEIGGPRFTFYKMDIDNDGQEEYVLTEKGDVGFWFDIDAVYKEDRSNFKDIYDEIKLPMRTLLREAQHANYNLEEGFVGISRGDMIVEKEGGKTYFSLVESHGTWLYCPKQKNAKCHWVKENCPEVHKFLWEGANIQLIKTYKRCLKPSDFRKIGKN